MKPILPNSKSLICFTVAAIITFMTGCASQLNTGVVKQDGKQLLHTEMNRLKPMELPIEINDLNKIPQDVRPFAAAIKAPLSADEQTKSLKRFREHYFSPWSVSAPLYDKNQARDDMNWISEKSWYGENRLKVDQEKIKELLNLAALDGIPSLNQLGITISPAYIRALPTIKPLYETADDFPFDQLQYTELKLNEPVRIRHTSTDGAWLYVETAYVSGWVRPSAIRYVDESLRQRLVSSAQVVIITDFAVIRDELGKALPQPKIGTLYPLVKEETDYWLINVAVAGEGEQATLINARIAKKDADRHPLTFTAETAAHIGNELLKTAYGWGEIYRDRDCSATTRDFFIPFGVWLPRNSLQQIKSGPFVSLADLSDTEKERVLREQGVPFLTIVHRKGHIMLYVGLFDGKPIILHNTWAIRFKSKHDPEEKFYIGRTILSTLEAGKELPLSRNTILHHLDSMLILPAMNQPEGGK